MTLCDLLRPISATVLPFILIWPCSAQDKWIKLRNRLQGNHNSYYEICHFEIIIHMSVVHISCAATIMCWVLTFTSKFCYVKEEVVKKQTLSPVLFHPVCGAFIFTSATQQFCDDVSYLSVPLLVSVSEFRFQTRHLSLSTSATHTHVSDLELLWTFNYSREWKVQKATVTRKTQYHTTSSLFVSQWHILFVVMALYVAFVSLYINQRMFLRFVSRVLKRSRLHSHFIRAEHRQDISDSRRHMQNWGPVSLVSGDVIHGLVYFCACSWPAHTVEMVQK